MSLNNIISNIELLEILKSVNIKINGVFTKDQIKTPLKDGFYIINLQDSDDGNGTHWVVLYKINDNVSFYYDSFGFPPPDNIEKILNKKYKYNTKQIQNINSTSCGFYCIAFIIFMKTKQDKLKAFDTFCAIFSNNTKNNEIILYQLLYR